MDTIPNNPIQITAAQASEIADEYFGIKGLCEKLVGYDEQNFKLKSENQEKFIIKISFGELPIEEFDFQYEVFNHLKLKNIHAPSVALTKKGEHHAIFKIGDKLAFARLLHWMDGTILGTLDKRPPSICSSLGKVLAENTLALTDFNHPYASRPFPWNSDDSLWLSDHFHLFSDENRSLAIYFHERFVQSISKIEKLRKSVIHNDANEQNILLTNVDFKPEVSTLIDYGDTVYSSTINNLAIALAYLIQPEEDILMASGLTVKAFDEVFPLEDNELELLFVLIGIRCLVSLTHSAISLVEHPENVYRQNNVAGNWAALKKLQEIGEVQFLEYLLGMLNRNSSLHDNFIEAIEQENKTLNDLFPTVNKSGVHLVDLGLNSDLVPHADDPFYEENFSINLARKQKDYPNSFLVGGYGEVRRFYTTDAYKIQTLLGYEHRSKHLGMDIWLPSNTAVHALWDGEVIQCICSEDHKDYGSMILLKHEIKKVPFYTLYGHLSTSSYEKINLGQKIKAGECFAHLGDYSENGHWVPHLHFQIILDLLGNDENFDGVASPDRWKLMSRICPNPNLVFQENIPEHLTEDLSTLQKLRARDLGFGLSLSYEDPLYIVRGGGAYLIDVHGQNYLDTVNNVAHVGHENYKVVLAGQKQMAKLNTNTRYLHPSVLKYASELKKTFPESLSVLHFTNSGSEANELALRMAKSFTGREDMLAIEVGYHGNTQGTIAISSYKFNAKGGKGKPRKTHLLDLPDGLRGKHSDKNSKSGQAYIDDAIQTIREHSKNGIAFAGFIHESILSCGGQIVLPPGYLKAIYQEIRSNGGVVIADEVQVGFGRVGEHFWGFQLQDVVPDIVVMGKPIGNGHPMGAVICTNRIAEAFNNGMEYFNTFGGNPVSAEIGLAVLDLIKQNKLQENAEFVGNYLKEKLKTLQDKFSIIAEVRGHGLFLGIEFLDQDKMPLAELVSHVINAMKARKVLMSSDGPDHNVIKIKPPIIFTKHHVDYLVEQLEEVLKLAVI